MGLPRRVVSNAELCETLNTSPAWIERKTGIRERRYLSGDESIEDLAVESADKAIRQAGLTPRDIDVLVVACSTPDWIMPSLGVIVADRLGIETPRIVDITQHACSSFVYATYIAAGLLQEPDLSNALVVCAEAASRGTDPADRRVRVFFGDASGAAVFTKTPGPHGMLSYDLGNAYSPGVALAGPALLNHQRATPGGAMDSPYLTMDGPLVWQEAGTRVPKSINAVLDAAGVELDDVDGIAIHQANIRLVEHIIESMGADLGKVGISGDVLGNTGAASPLTSLWRLAADGRARAGDTIVIGAIGAGFLWGSLCFRLPFDISVDA
ncbi:3-oxoacyl-ACP synthase III family protein [Nonomuraea candida]|uniref:3-oxoacyl-ACP synthase III family protein n=1 Tax=Nonomuraea candida TaxID=359159 RepID=UPI000A9545D1|nr:ketoacyl-ACP synthase III [Nonomuraea candida]